MGQPNLSALNAQSKLRLGAVLMVLASLFTGLIETGPVSTSAAATTSGWQKGVSLTPYNGIEDWSTPKTDAALELARQTNVNYVTLIVQYYQDTIYSSGIFKGPYAPSEPAIIHAIQKAHSLGLKVAFKPHIDPSDGRWRADINPTDRDAWFANYGAILNYYADLGKKYGVEQISIGAELIKISTHTANPDNTQRWLSLIAQVRQRYNGLLTYSANWGGNDAYEEFNRINFWNALDFIGISAYFELANKVNPTVPELLSSWSYWNANKIQPFQQAIGKPVIFTEVGYRSVDGAARYPWDSTMPGAYNAQEQANAIEAAIQFWSAYPWFKGLHYWWWDTNPAGGGPGDTDYWVTNKPGQTTLRNGYAAGLEQDCTVVVKTEDDGTCGTLRKAVAEAAIHPTNKTVTFNLPVAGQVVKLTTGALTVGSGVEVKGSVCQPNEPITIEGGGATDTWLTLNGATLRNLKLVGLNNQRVKVTGTNNQLICVQVMKQGTTPPGVSPNSLKTPRIAALANLDKFQQNGRYSVLPEAGQRLVAVTLDFEQDFKVYLRDSETGLIHLRDAKGNIYKTVGNQIATGLDPTRKISRQATFIFAVPQAASGLTLDYKGAKLPL